MGSPRGPTAWLPVAFTLPDITLALAVKAAPQHIRRRLGTFQPGLTKWQV